MTKAFYAIVHGLVQGVAFRHHTRVTANELGLSGWVRNLPNGTVELTAEGEETALQKLADWLEHGPRYARVDEVRLSWQEPTGLEGPFQIRF